MIIAFAIALSLAVAQAETVSARHASRQLRPGELVLLTIEARAVPVTVRAFDRDWPVYSADAGRWQALIGIDLETGVGRHEVAIAAGSARTTYFLDVKPRVFNTRRLTVDPALVNPPPDALARIAAETRELEEVWRASAGEPLWHGPFVRPVPDPANSAFGTRSILNGEPRSPHNGTDFLSPSGRPVKAPNAGRVVIADSRYFSGNTVVIDHGLGLFSLLAHLSQIDVRKGDTVQTGDLVGKVGATGRVTGAHLHWTVRANGARVDPLSLLFVTANRSSGKPR